MTIKDIRFYNNNGLLWTMGDTPFVSFGSFGQNVIIEIDVQTTKTIYGNLTFDASMFSELPFDAYPDDLHPVFSKEARGFILDVSSLAVSTPTQMLNYGNDLSHNIGVATLEITNVGKTEFTITHEFTLLKDVNGWMHSTETTTIDSSDASTSYGDFTTIYDIIKYYNVYVWFLDEWEANGVPLAFSRLNEYNNGSALFEDIEYIYKDSTTLNTQEFLSTNNDTIVRVEFNDVSNIASRVDLSISSVDVREQGTRDERIDLSNYTTTTINVISGTNKYVEFTIPKENIDYNKSYRVIATILDAANRSTSVSGTTRGGFVYTECVPKIDVNWKSYLNTRNTSKIDVAPYERMCLELTIWHDRDPLISPSYEGCLTSQDIFNNTFLGSMQSLTIPILGETHIFTNTNGVITSNYTQDEIESGSSGGFDYTKFKIFFRATDLYVGQLFTFDAQLKSVFNSIIAVNGTLVNTPVVEHIVNQPLELRVAIYENDNPGASVTSLEVYDNGVLSGGGICNDSEFFECVAESTDTSFQVQALLTKPNQIKEEELFNSVQSESYFDTLTDNRIYDLEGDFTTANDCKFKVTNEQEYDKIMVICCK